MVGYQHHGRLLAALINRWCEGWSAAWYAPALADSSRALNDLRNAAALVVFGGPAPDPLLEVGARTFDVPIFVIWAGTDVLEAMRDPKSMALVLLRQFKHIAVAPWLVPELESVGIDAEYLRVAAAPVDKYAHPLPQRFSILTYLPEPRRDFYGRERIIEIARRFPDVPVIVTGSGAPDPHAPTNMQYVGHADVGPIIDKTTCVVRLCEHDGMSLMIVEAMARGRHCIWNYALPGVREVDGTAGAIAAIDELLSEHEAGTLGINEVGRRYVAANADPENIAQGIVAHICAAWRNEYSESRNSRERRVAVSGHPMFVQRIAERLEKQPIGWHFEFLQTASKLHTLQSLWTLFMSDVWYVVGTPEINRWIDAAAKLLRKRTLFHWIGSDIPLVHRTPRLRKRWTRPEVSHLTEAPWTRQELRGMGVLAAVAALPVRLGEGELPPLPATFTLLFYIPTFRGEFYGISTYQRLVERFAPEGVRFLIVGGGSFGPIAGADIHNIGWTDSLADVYAESTALVRMTERDGLSLMVLEALSYGRYVFWPQPFEAATTVTNYETLEGRIEELLAQHRAGTLQPNATAAEYIRKAYGDSETVGTLALHWEVTARRRRSAKPVHGRAAEHIEQ